MSTTDSNSEEPTESELAAVGQTIAMTRRDIHPVRDRLAAASQLLRSLPAPPTAAALVFSRGGDAAVEAVPIGEGVTIGRGKDATICLESHTDLSRQHFSVRPEADLWLLEDRGSRNGTMVDGVEGRVTRRALRDGDIIFAGDLLFLFVKP